MLTRHAARGAALLLLAASAHTAGAADDVATRLAAASGERGALAFQICGACHTVNEGEPTRVGPNLWDVVGSEVATRKGYEYSPALRDLGGVWTLERLDEFLSAPIDYAPGTRMVYPGVSDPAVRADIIEFLRTHTDTPVDRPAGGAVVASTPASDPFGKSWPEGPGRDVTGFVCQACHSLAIVKQQGLPRDRWDELLVWMVEEQGMDPLEPQQRDLVLDYLSESFGIER